MCLLTQLCPTLCDPKDCSPPGSSVHGILQARILERVASSFSNVCVYIHTHICKGFPGSSVVKSLPPMQETQVRSLSWEDPLEESMATHSSILAWRIP